MTLHKQFPRSYVLISRKRSNDYYAQCSTYVLFLYKNTFFPKKICVIYAGCALALSESLVPSDAACWKSILILLCSNEFSNIPPKLRSLNAAHTHFFYTKIHFFLKKFAYVHFL